MYPVTHIFETRSALTLVAKLLCSSFRELPPSCLFAGYFKDDLLCHFCASMISGLATTLASMPVDIAKTRLVQCNILNIHPPPPHKMFFGLNPPSPPCLENPI